MFGPSKEEKYAKFINANQNALHARTTEIIDGLTQTLLQVRSQLTQGQTASLNVAIMGEDNAPPPETHPLDHAAFCVAADLLVAWCGQNRIVARKRTIPAAADTHPFWVREIVVDVSIPK